MVEEGNKLLDKNLGQVVEQQSAMLNAEMTGKAKQKEIANEETRANRRQENVFKKIAGSLGFLEDSAEEGDGEKKGFFGSLISKIGAFATQILALPAIFVGLKASLVAFGATRTTRHTHRTWCAALLGLLHSSKVSLTDLVKVVSLVGSRKD